MPKFSIIVPVYNVENYIKACLDSIEKQTFKDYEVILVDDGSTDKSMDIAKKYKGTIIHQENRGLSSARNHGVKKATGEYIVFVDSDDTIEKDLLKELDKATKEKVDLVRYQLEETYEDQGVIKYPEEGFETCSGEEAFQKIVNYHFVENPVGLAIRREYWLKEKYAFQEGRLHEDFGLIPLVIIKAKTVKSISYIGYNYRQRPNSIMRNQDYQKTKRKVEDFYFHYQFLIKEIEKTKINSTIFKSYLANSLILKITELQKEDYQKYKKKLKEEKVFDNILTDTLPRKIKKVILQISPKIYYRKK